VKKLILTLVIAATQFAFAQDAKNLENYRDQLVSQMPDGTRAIFEAPILITKNASEIRIAALKTSEACYFGISRKLVAGHDRTVGADVTREIVRAQDNYSAVFFSDVEDMKVYIYCLKENLTIGQFVEALAGRVRFDFPEAPVARDFEFPEIPKK
jgi:hypothetical protein